MARRQALGRHPALSYLWSYGRLRERGPSICRQPPVCPDIWIWLRPTDHHPHPTTSAGPGAVEPVPAGQDKRPPQHVRYLCRPVRKPREVTARPDGPDVAPDPRRPRSGHRNPDRSPVRAVPDEPLRSHHLVPPARTSPNRGRPDQSHASCSEQTRGPIRRLAASGEAAVCCGSLSGRRRSSSQPITPPHAPSRDSPRSAFPSGARRCVRIRRRHHPSDRAPAARHRRRRGASPCARRARRSG